jgi:hypothetical protein
MEKKYVVLVLNNPYGRDDGFQIHPATGTVLNIKMYDTKEDAEKAAEELRKQVSHSEIRKQFTITEDVFCELREFVLQNSYINVDGETIQCTYSDDKLIATFMEMYGFTDKYTADDFKHDEKLYQRLIGEEPKISVVEVGA